MSLLTDKTNSPPGHDVLEMGYPGVINWTELKQESQPANANRFPMAGTPGHREDRHQAT